MTFKVGDLTKNSKWKLTKEVPFYELVQMCSWGAHQILNTTCNAPVGTEFTVGTSRLSGDFDDRKWDQVQKKYLFTWKKSGIYYITEFQGKKGLIFFTDLSDSIEVLEQPKDVVYSIKDTKSNTYFSETMWFSWAEKTSKQYKEAKENKLSTLKKSESTQEIEESTIKFSSTALSGKVLKTLAQAKQKLLVICGYYNSSDSEMLHNHAPINSIPESWKIVSYDRTTKTEEVLDIDCTQYINHAFELKKLTTNYGSSVRDLYSKLEKKNELQKYKHFLIFTPGDISIKPLKEYMYSDNSLIEENENQDYYGDQQLPGRYRIKEDEVKILKKLIHKDLKKSIKFDSICIAVESKIEALELAFTYYGNLSYKVIDMTTLKEVVSE